MNTDTILDILEAFGEDLLKDLDTSLKAKGHGGKSNGAAQSAGIIGTGNFKVASSGGGGLSIQFYMNDYWYFLEYGRKPTRSGGGKKPFNQSLAGRIYESGWDVSKKINAREWYRKKLKNPGKSKKLKDYESLRKSLAYAIAFNIHRKGTIKRFNYQGSKFLTDVLNDGRVAKLSEQLTEAIGKEIVIDINKSFNQ